MNSWASRYKLLKFINEYFITVIFNARDKSSPEVSCQVRNRCMVQSVSFVFAVVSARCRRQRVKRWSDMELWKEWLSRKTKYCMKPLYINSTIKMTSIYKNKVWISNTHSWISILTSFYWKRTKVDFLKNSSPILSFYWRSPLKSKNALRVNLMVVGLSLAVSISSTHNILWTQGHDRGLRDIYYNDVL